MAKKYSRNKDRPSDKAYKAERRDLKNKERKVLKHLTKHPNDKQSVDRPVVDYKTILEVGNK